MTNRSTLLLRGALAVLALALLAPGCGDDPSEPEPPDLLEPPPPGEGVQFRMNTEVPAGTEVEHCLFVKAPAETMFVNRDEVRYTAGSHHFLLYETSYTEIPTAKDDGTPVDTSGVFDCTDGATDGWSVTKLIGGSQNSDGDSMLAFPPDVALRVAPGRVLLMNAHYINVSDQPLEPEVRINLYTIPEADVEHEGDVLFLYNPLIVVPPGAESRARMRCPVYEEITIVNVQSHMHARGVDYAAMIGGEEPFYVNTEWEDVPAVDLGEGLVIPAGATLDYYCDYRNTELREVVQGPKSTDEMCMLIGSYYPANLALANCETPDRTELASEWVGTGEATCAQTFSCTQGAFQTPDVLPALSRCMYDASPSVSKPASEAVLCAIFAEDPEAECGEAFATCLSM